MAQFVRGVVVYVPFPFADSARKTRRPALILATAANYGDFVLCMITARYSDLAVKITKDDFEDGGLPFEESYVRPDRLFTAESGIVTRAGKLNSSKMAEIMKQVSTLFGLNP